MLGNQGKACKVTQVLVPGAKADTAAATSLWIDCRHYDGDIVIISQTGTVTGGSITPVLHTASDDTGTGDVAITPNEGAFTAITTSNDPLTEKRTIDARDHSGYLGIVGTIVTGPVDYGVIIIAQQRYLS